MSTNKPKKDCILKRFQLVSSDQFSDLALDWDVNWRQLQKGCFKGDFLKIEDHEVQVYQFSMNRIVEMRGCAPGGEKRRSFGFMRQGNYFGTWCGKQIFDDSLIVWGKNSEYEAITTPDFNVNVVTLSDELFNEAAKAMGYQRPLDYLFNESFVLFNQGRKIKQLRDLLEILRSKLTGQPSNLFVPNYWQNTKFKIAQLIISMLVNHLPDNDSPKTPSKRLSALKHAVEYIEENVDMSISVRNLCSITGVSERTLEYAFQDHFHLSPKTYLKAVRLNGVRKQLRHTNLGDTLITEVANVWGFWHMGQFAADYYKFFSEKPSDTLHRQ